MSDRASIRAGLEVYGADNRLVGVVEGERGGGIRVDGRTIPATAIAHVGRGRVYLRAVAAQYGAPTDQR
ncbi:MAG TPA: hypothetical protein VFW96_23885 [Thermomicrobiales bacterium]|nr:hypothetical protein [Thermomicrobiales bacterium]